MRVADKYFHIWPESRAAQLNQFFGEILCEKIPRPNGSPAVDFTRTIGIGTDASVTEVVHAACTGFHHVIQEKKPDFLLELVSSAVLIQKPQVFFSNPIPFFFRNFDANSVGELPETNLETQITGGHDKLPALERLRGYLDGLPQTAAVKDLALQVADEMIMNALFNAPTAESGALLFRDIPRHNMVKYPAGKVSRLFACATSKRLLVGLQDPFGSLDGTQLRMRLMETFLRGPTAPVRLTSAGAGLGFHFMISNSAGFYVCRQHKIQTLVCAVFDLGGLVQNTDGPKNLHLCFL